jgi:N-acetylmuramoyl-L-alanine amidase
MPTIVIDIGHHENDSGAVANSLREVDLNVSICKYLVKELERHGLKVVVTTGTLQNRAKVANDIEADWFISVHNNAGGGDGTEVLVYSNQLPQKAMAQNILDEIVNQGLNNSRGIKERPDVYVLRKTIMPAVLIECAFIDTKDKECIDEEHEREVFGKAIAKGILKTLKIDYIEEQPKTSYMHRICVGAYKDKDNALKALEIAKKTFKDAYIIREELKNG